MRRLAREHEVLLPIEEGVSGGFGAHVLHFLATNGLLDRGPKVRPMVLPDRFLDQDKPQLQYAAAGLLARHIQVTALTALEFQPKGGPGSIRGLEIVDQAERKKAVATRVIEDVGFADPGKRDRLHAQRPLIRDPPVEFESHETRGAPRVEHDASE